MVSLSLCLSFFLSLSGNITHLQANVSTSPLYGTLTVRVKTAQLPGVSVYYVSYMKTDANISLYDSDQPCSEQG